MNLCTSTTVNGHDVGCKYHRCKPGFDAWSLTFAYLWYEGTEDHGRIINICRDRETRKGIPDVFG